VQIVIIGSQQFHEAGFFKKPVNIGATPIFIFGVEFQAEGYKG
jgi:hypothetical protein